MIVELKSRQPNKSRKLRSSREFRKKLTRNKPRISKTRKN